MYDAPQNSADFEYSAMTFNDKISAAFDLTKRYGLTIFLTCLATWVLIVVVAFLGIMVFGGLPILMGGGLSAEPSTGFAIGAIFGILVIYFCVALLGQYFTIGINSLILKYVDGQETEGGVINQVLSPWRNFLPILFCLLIWLAIYFAVMLVLGIIGLIPILGILINLVGMFFVSMIMFCVFFYIADVGRPDIGNAIKIPINIVKNNLLHWVVAMATAIAVSLPGAILIGIIFAVAGNSVIVMLFGLLLGVVYFAAASIFILLFFAITYRQSFGGGMKAVADQVF